MDSEEQTSFNWTVDSGTHSIEIFTLLPSRLYWVTVAAVNGAGVGVQSDPYKLLIGTLKKLIIILKCILLNIIPVCSFFPSESRLEATLYQTGILSMSHFLSVIKEPVFIGSVGTLLWCVLMITAVFLYRRHIRQANPGGKSSGNL